MAEKTVRLGDANIELYFRVLGYQTDNRWAAHCLETDIVGYGDTFDAALKQLIELTEMQVSFALFKNQPALLDHPAPLEIIEMYQHVYRSRMTNFYSAKKGDAKRTVTSIPYPKRIKPVDFSLAQA